jgi:hypothetical protein
MCALAADGGRGGPRRIPSNESFSSLTLAIKAMTRFGPNSYGNLHVSGIELLLLLLLPPQ